MDNIKDHIKKRLDEKKKPDIIKYELLSKGFLEYDVDKAIKKHTGQSTREHVVERFVFKELFYKLSSGFGSDQFIYIFLFLLTGSYFILGLGVGITVVLSLLLSLFLNDYFKVRKVTKTMISLIGLVICICFIAIAFAIFYEIWLIIIIAIIVLGLGNVFLGEVYSNAFSKEVENKTESFWLTRIGGYSLFFVVIGLIIGAYFLEKYSTGYYYVFIIAAVCLLVSAIVLQTLIKKRMQIETTHVSILFKQRLKDIRKWSKLIFKNKVIKFLAIGTIITGLVQTIGNTYYGVFVYRYFTYIGWGGFLNVAVIFSVPIITSLFSAVIAKMLSKQYGNIPSLVFGTMLIAILPLTMWLRPNLISISMAMVCAVVGGAIVGLATGLLLSNYVDHEMRNWYFQSYTLLICIAYIIFIPIAALFAQYGSLGAIGSLQALFGIMGGLLIIVVVPMYFSMLFIEKKVVV